MAEDMKTLSSHAASLQHLSGAKYVSWLPRLAPPGCRAQCGRPCGPRSLPRNDFETYLSLSCPDPVHQHLLSSLGGRGWSGAACERSIAPSTRCAGAGWTVAVCRCPERPASTRRTSSHPAACPATSMLTLWTIWKPSETRCERPPRSIAACQARPGRVALLAEPGFLRPRPRACIGHVVAILLPAGSRARLSPVLGRPALLSECHQAAVE